MTFVWLCIGAGQASPIDALAGRYLLSFDGEMADGSRYPAKRTIEIVTIDRTHAYVRAELDFANAHHCGIFGVARSTGNTLVYAERSAQPGERRCRLTIAPVGKSLSLDDDGGSCQAYCGAGGSLSNFDFPMSLRRQLHDEGRVKRSDEYRAAIDDWKSSNGNQSR